MLKKASKFDINFLVNSVIDPSTGNNYNNYKLLCSSTRFDFKINKYGFLIIIKKEKEGWFFKLINREMHYCFYNFKHNYYNSDYKDVKKNDLEYYTDNVFDCIDLLFTGDFGIP